MPYRWQTSATVTPARWSLRMPVIWSSSNFRLPITASVLTKCSVETVEKRSDSVERHAAFAGFDQCLCGHARDQFDITHFRQPLVRYADCRGIIGLAALRIGEAVG